jgi:hypothetical protein
VYAMGVILYEMLTGHVPFEGETVAEVLMKHLTAQVDVSGLPAIYRPIVQRALAKDPKDRPVRLRELLPAGDAPADPEVRVIGDAWGAAAPGAVGGHGAGVSPPPVEDVLYIGPDTRPGDGGGRRAEQRRGARERRAAVKQAIRTRIRANLDALTRPARYQSPPRPSAAPAFFAGYADAPPQAAPKSPETRNPFPEPPPRPTPRMRIAELAASMLWSAPLVGLLVVPAMILLSINPAHDPARFAYLYLLSLLGAWLVLIPNKLLEHRTIDPAFRRLIGMAGGMVLGVAAIAMYHVLKLDWPLSNANFDQPRHFEVIYFGALYTLTAGWFSITERARPARFRWRPVFWTMAAAAVLTLTWPYDGSALPIVVAVLIPVAVQLVSPWDKAASAYRRSLAAARRRGRLETA